MANRTNFTKTEMSYIKSFRYITNGDKASKYNVWAYMVSIFRKFSQGYVPPPGLPKLPKKAKKGKFSMIFLATCYALLREMSLIKNFRPYLMSI